MANPKGIMARKVKVRGNMNPPQGAEVKEIYDGKTVYVVRKENLIPIPAIDDTGEPVYIKDPKTGANVRRRNVLAPDPKQPFIEEEFVLVDLGNGVVQKNYDFRRAEGEAAPSEVTTPDATIEGLQSELNAMRKLVEHVLAQQADPAAALTGAAEAIEKETKAASAPEEDGEAPAKPKRKRTRKKAAPKK